jgi:hypothetical protein
MPRESETAVGALQPSCEEKSDCHGKKHYHGPSAFIKKIAYGRTCKKEESDCTENYERAAFCAGHLLHSSGTDSPTAAAPLDILAMPESRRCALVTELMAVLVALLLSCLAPHALANQATGKLLTQEIDRRMLASLPTWHGRSASIVDDLDLTFPFATQGQWTFVVARLPGSRLDAFLEPVDGGSLAVCLVEQSTPHCKYTLPPSESSLSWFSVPVAFYSAQIVLPGLDRAHPLLLLSTGAASGANGGHAIYTQLFAYDRQRDQFESVFHNGVGSNNNQETRFVEHGPLRGDVIVAAPTESAPYGYWISVFPWNSSHPYSSIALRYRSGTRYGDGNPLPVIDSEMPNILKHLGQWKSGDRLPIPGRMPMDCTGHLYLRGGEEWCERIAR